MIQINKKLKTKLINFRKILHQFPELSNNEKNSSKRIIKFISQFNPDKIIKNIGGYGVAFVFKGKKKGKTVVFRAELDALPIEEKSSHMYVSAKKGVSHLCGHDGHMAILAGLAKFLNDSNPKKGKVVLLFQPAEETGEGARRVINDKKFINIKPDYIFGLHNLPGYKANKIILKKNVFSAASVGIILNLIGETAHAAEPEKGKSPALAISKLIKEIKSINNKKDYKGFAFGTIININLGKKAFGTAPGNGTMMITLRANYDQDLNLLKKRLTKKVKKITKQQNLKYEIKKTDYFVSTKNNNKLIMDLKNIAKMKDFNYKFIKNTFKWSEDFGYYTEKYKSVFFGLGAGREHLNLHNSQYDFNDNLIFSGIKIFYSIAQEYNY